MALMAILLLHSDITINERKREKKKRGSRLPPVSQTMSDKR